MAFLFKQFAVDDSRCGMKVGTDAVVLGSCVPLRQPRRILDVGTGCGIIALMLAQRLQGQDYHIDGIDSAAAAEQARENVEKSPWKQRMRIYKAALQVWMPPAAYDMVICNPPYFRKDLLTPDPLRRAARHQESLTLEVLITFYLRHTTKTGTLSVIYPMRESDQFLQHALRCDLFPIQILTVYSIARKPPIRQVVTVGKSPCTTQFDTLVLQDDQGQRTASYRQLTQDFYLS